MGPADLGEPSGTGVVPFGFQLWPSLGSPQQELENRKVRSGYYMPLVSFPEKAGYLQSEIRPTVSGPLSGFYCKFFLWVAVNTLRIMGTMLCIFLFWASPLHSPSCATFSYIDLNVQCLLPSWTLGWHSIRGWVARLIGRCAECNILKLKLIN